MLFKFKMPPTFIGWKCFFAQASNNLETVMLPNISIGYSLISTAIWENHARVSLLNIFVALSKFHEKSCYYL